MKYAKFLGLAFLSAGLLAACNNNSSVRDDAAQSLQDPVQPVEASAMEAANAVPAPTGPTTTMTFDETEFNFGTVNDGEVVEHVFTFTNTGKEPLIISNASGSCGCTVPEWPKEAIKPGDKGKVTVRFDSKKKAGDRRQKVTITANTNPAQTFLYLVGKVNAAEGSDPAQNNTIQINQ